MKKYNPYPIHPWVDPKYDLLSEQSKGISVELADDCEALGKKLLEMYPDKPHEWTRPANWGKSLVSLANDGDGFRGNISFPELTDTLEDDVNYLEIILDEMEDFRDVDKFANEIAELRDDIDEARHCIIFDRSRFYRDCGEGV